MLKTLISLLISVSKHLVLLGDNLGISTIVEKWMLAWTSMYYLVNSTGRKYIIIRVFFMVIMWSNQLDISLDESTVVSRFYGHFYTGH